MLKKTMALLIVSAALSVFMSVPTAPEASNSSKCRQMKDRCVQRCNSLTAGDVNFRAVYQCQKAGALMEGCRVGCYNAEITCNQVF
jgi:hypothetical protein